MPLVLCACAGLYDKEYVSIEDYVFPEQSQAVPEDEVLVKTAFELKTAILSFVESGQTEGAIVFSEDYAGNLADDLADACWKVRSQNALCAYCVENISYDLNQIVSYYKAAVRISYSADATELVKIPYSSGLDEVILKELENGSTGFAVLINSSMLSTADFENTVSSLYEGNPMVAPCCPGLNTTLYSGVGYQKLYDVRLKYDAAPEDMPQMLSDMQSAINFTPEEHRLPDYEKAVLAGQRVLENLEILPEGDSSTVYDALVNKSSDSRGVALAYVAACKELGLECLIVHGQCNKTDYSWNLVKIGDRFYHASLQSGTGIGTFRSDEEMWMNYRWDTSFYPNCPDRLIIDTAP